MVIAIVEIGQGKRERNQGASWYSVPCWGCIKTIGHVRGSWPIWCCLCCLVADLRNGQEYVKAVSCQCSQLCKRRGDFCDHHLRARLWEEIWWRNEWHFQVEYNPHYLDYPCPHVFIYKSSPFMTLLLLNSIDNGESFAFSYLDKTFPRYRRRKLAEKNNN